MNLNRLSSALYGIAFAVVGVALYVVVLTNGRFW